MVSHKGLSDKTFDIVNNALVFIIILIVVYPLIYILSASVSDPLDVLNGKVVLLPSGLNFEAYKKTFGNGDIITGYKNSIMYTLVGTIVNVVLTVCAAYPLSRKDFYGRGFFTAMFAVTMFFGGGLIPTYLVIKSLGLLNNFWVMILPGAVGMTNIIITRTFFQSSIPAEIQEAAVIDGCSNFRMLFRIILPLSLPVLAVITMYYAVGHWNSFFNALIYITDREKFPLQLVLRELLITSTKMTDMMATEGAASQQMQAETLKYAVIVVSSVPMLILYPFFQRFFVKGVMVGAIKG